MELKINSPKYGEKIVLIDDEDYERIKDYKWCTSYDPTIKGFYVTALTPFVNKKRKSLKIHRVIMGDPTNKKVDHINGNTLDNRKENLRVCSNQENCMNRKSTNQFNYKGVSKNRNKYEASIFYNRKRKYLGLFDNPDQAAIAYNIAALKYFGEFARPNINIMMQ